MPSSPSGFINSVIVILLFICLLIFYFSPSLSCLFYHKFQYFGSSFTSNFILVFFKEFYQKDSHLGRRLNRTFRPQLAKISFSHLNIVMCGSIVIILSPLSHQKNNLLHLTYRQVNTFRYLLIYWVNWKLSLNLSLLSRQKKNLLYTQPYGQPNTFQVPTYLLC